MRENRVDLNGNHYLVRFDLRAAEHSLCGTLSPGPRDTRRGKQENGVQQGAPLELSRHRRYFPPYLPGLRTSALKLGLTEFWFPFLLCLLL